MISSLKEVPKSCTSSLNPQQKRESLTSQIETHEESDLRATGSVSRMIPGQKFVVKEILELLRSVKVKAEPLSAAQQQSLPSLLLGGVHE